MKSTLPGGFVSYSCDRKLDQYRRYIFAIHFSPEEVSQGRDYIANRLKRWRSEFRNTIQRELECSKR